MTVLVKRRTYREKTFAVSHMCRAGIVGGFKYIIYSVKKFFGTMKELGCDI